MINKIKLKLILTKIFFILFILFFFEKKLKYGEENYREKKITIFCFSIVSNRINIFNFLKLKDIWLKDCDAFRIFIEKKNHSNFFNYLF